MTFPQLPSHILGYIILCCLWIPYSSAQVVLDESPVKAGEWGHRPDEGATVAVNPPSFVWRPSRNVSHWELIIKSETSSFVYMAIGLLFNTYTPSDEFPPGHYTWQFRGIGKDGKPTAWSVVRSFTVPSDARSMPLPPREELLNRVPKTHPRIFVRPEGRKRLRELAKDKLSAEYQTLVQRCDRLLQEPPDTTEPPVYESGRRTPDELNIWWNNRVRTIAVLENAAMLAFVWNLDGNKQYAELAKKLLMESAKWDPKGATGFRYNDEAGMPYNYHFARTYTFLNAYLSKEEKKICRAVMTIRGKEMYDFLCPRMLWNPYESHDNRSWHFLGEVGLAFYGEIPEAGDWLWFAINKFYSSYPAWCDDDGGWHEGFDYWNSYQIRFCWWADAMKAAFGINAFDKPYYSQIGFYPMYQMPPGTRGRLLGDQCHSVSSTSCLPLADIVAMQSGNPYWRWYVDAHKDFLPSADYYTFIRKAAMLDQPPVTAQEPTDLPTSKLFRGTGIVASNTSLLNATDNVQLLFKSTPAPFGTYSHGYDANNSYMFSAWNENLLISTGQRDYYGSPFHQNWMWTTRSQNNITVDGIGQLRRSRGAVGEVVRFVNEKLGDGTEYDIIIGEASEGYQLEPGAPAFLVEKYPDGKLLDGFRRNIVFLKPDVLIVYDRLKARQPAQFEYWLHAKNPFMPLERYFPNGKSKATKPLADYFKERLGQWKMTDPEAVGQFEPIMRQTDIGIRINNVACRIDLLIPDGLTFTQTNQYDPAPQEKITAREWHLTAKTAEQRQEEEFLLVVRPWKIDAEETVPALDAHVERQENDAILHVKSNGKMRTVRFPSHSDDVEVR